jgi:hypothetical protein
MMLCGFFMFLLHVAFVVVTVDIVTSRIGLLLLSYCTVLFNEDRKAFYTIFGEFPTLT